MKTKIGHSLVSALLILASIWSLAASPVASGSGTGPTFTVTPVYPENQRAKSGYFDLRVEPGQTQELKLVVANNDNQAIEVEVEALNASTAPDGFIDYSTPGIRDESMLYPFDQLAQVEASLIEIPAMSSKEIGVTVQVPDESFDGMILGGIRVLKLVEADASTMITNAYQYALAVVLTTNDTPVQPDFSLVDVDFGLEDYRATVVASIRNDRPAPARGVSVEAGLYQAGEAEPFYILNKQVSIAPNSVWNCPFTDQEGYGFASGNYLFRMRMELDEEVWEFEREFSITQTDADIVNTNAVNQQPQYAHRSGFPLWATISIIAGLIFLLALILLLVLVLKKRKNA